MVLGQKQHFMHLLAEAMGGTPMAGLVFDGDGNFYGTTESGGGGPCDTLVPSGCGTVFKLNRSPDGSWAEGVLHAFAGLRRRSQPSGRTDFRRERQCLWNNFGRGHSV